MFNLFILIVSLSACPKPNLKAGRSELHEAAILGDLDCLNRLLESGASMEALAGEGGRSRG